MAENIGDEILKDITTVALAIVTVATFAVIVSKQSNTTGVINSGSSAFNTGLATAEGPVTGYTPGAPIYATGGGFTLPQLGQFGEIGAGYNTAGA